MNAVVTIALPFFALIFTGMIAGRTRLMPAATIAGINTFVFYFALPALLVSSIARAPVEGLRDPALFIAWLLPGLAVFGGTYALTGLLFGGSRGVRAIRGLAGAFANVGFVGLPLVIAALGDEATPAAVVVITVDTAVLIGLATALIELDRGERGSVSRAVRTAAVGVVRSPLILAAAAGLLLGLSPVSLPEPVTAYLELLGGAAGPAALFALGATLARPTGTSRFRETGILVGAKLMVHPVLVWLATGLLGVPPVAREALTILAALPTAANVYVLAQRYEINVGGASAAILVSTVLAVASVSAVLHRLVG